MTVCACGSGLDFDDCCGPVLAGRPALTAESLMRSRYSAFVLRDLDYIQRSQGREVNQDFNRLEAERALEETEWQRLELLGVVQGGVDDDIGHVEFIIHHTRRGKPLTQHELASFCREDSVWLYYGGKLNPKSPPRNIVKIGRNELCSCGSGKKYKKCCGL